MIPIQTTTFTPSEVNMRIQWILEALPDLQDIWIEGEISNLKHYHKGNQLYFNLCDENSQINCVLYSTFLQQLKFNPKNGLLIRAKAKLKVYYKRGSFQLQIAYMTPIQKGALSQQLNALKQKLQKEGLFDPHRKQPIPTYNTHIGLITALDSAAQHDICQLLSRYAPHIHISIYPSVMQGIKAAPSILSALHYFESKTTVDTIVIARGGGSAEDLFCFNDEQLVRFIAALTTPILTAIGHETDHTLCDDVADLRCETPSSAAAIIYTPYHTLKRTLSHTLISAYNTITKKQNQYHNRLNTTLSILSTLISEKQNQHHTTLSTQLRLLETLNPIRKFDQGYSLCHTQSGTPIKSITDIQYNDPITTRVKDGRIISTVNKIIKDKVI
tara:strand:+ start:123 stop:1280 length:1158 start_codon:yes stop_codon:yes gene_type:complete